MTIRAGFSLLLLSLLAAGCGWPGSTAATPIEGNILYDGRPLDFGTISFENTNGSGTFYEAPIQNGRYLVVIPSKAIKGEMTVKVKATYRTGRRIQVPIGDNPNATVDELMALPARFNSQSILRFRPKPGEMNRHDLDLKSK